VTVDMKGLAPDQRWFGEPNDYIVRESYIYDVVAANFTPGATVSDEGGTGFELAAGPYVGEVAGNYDFQGPASSPAERRDVTTPVSDRRGGRSARPRRPHRPRSTHQRTHRRRTRSRHVLELANVEVVYNDVILVLRGLSIEVPDGQIVALLGANGAGKTTTLRAVSGLLLNHDGEITKGTVTYNGEVLNGKKPSDIVNAGITQVMEGRRVFGELTVDENLVCGGITVKDKARTRCVRAGHGPVPPPRRAPQAGRRLPLGRRAADARDRAGADGRPEAARARRAVARPRPEADRADPRHHRRHQQQGTSVLLIEQNAMMALSIANYGYIMETGKVVMDGDAKKLLADDDVKEFYLGLHGEEGAKKSFRDVKHYKRRKRWAS
jgi:branched-chain amino acid transport system ATP-binding protein